MEICKKASGIICSTDYLSNFYRKRYPGKPVFVCPNQMEPDDWPQRGPANVTYPDDGILRIGWFASPSHIEDCYLIERGLEWAAKQEGVEVCVMGLEPTWWKFPFRYIPWSNDLSVYQACVGRLDIGLAPIKNDVWSLCRSDLKALDYGVCSIAPIISNNAPYSMWTHEENCLKASTPKEFLYHIKRLVNNPRERQELSNAAHAYVVSERTIEKNVWRWQEAIHGVKPVCGDRSSIATFSSGPGADQFLGGLATRS